jgi:Xaa-Pro aminopeptidase
MDYSGRRQRLQLEVQRLKLDAILITHLPNVRYLTGFTGSAGALLIENKGQSKPLFVTDGRYMEQAREQVNGARIAICKRGVLAGMVREIAARKPRRLGIEADHMTVKTRSLLLSELPGSRLAATSGAVEKLRMLKEPAEVEAIREAVVLGARLLPGALRALRPGRTEAEVAARIEYMARRAGAERMSFETIVASGPRSAMPHGVASSAPLPQRGFVVLDYGVILHGYCSDMTRTVHLGRPGAQARAWYGAVLQAQLAAISAVRPGTAFAEVDREARLVLKGSKLEKFFTHSTGHGVGLEIHEPPRLAAGQEETLEAGMVITIEPGIYVAGKGGIRIEDVVLVTSRGYELLTPARKDFVQL